ncbi:hypothetical protein GF312_15360 [Candidatus Poribacteria bacterium]|nr:hypothetical protein [Candidatus Poribacteria bacterium]
MQLRSKLAKTIVILSVCIGITIILNLAWYKSSSKDGASSGADIFLARPAFAQEEEASFLDKEAGIAAYTNLGQTVNLGAVKTAFRTIEKEEGNYIVGSYPVPGYEDEEAEDVHCFIHINGWIVTYYSQEEPSSKIVRWKDWDSKTIGTKIEDTLIAAGNVIGVAPKNIKYYHFKYPEAAKFMIIADNDDFKITIPGDLIIHERTHSTIGSEKYSKLNIDGVSKGKGDGFLSYSDLKPDVTHDVATYYSNTALVIIYQ